MGLFNREAPHRTADKAAINSIIGRGLSIVGDLSFSGKLKLDGTIKGNVKGEYLVIGKTGGVTGDVDAETCICQGKVRGNIKSKDLTVVKGCRIEGNVETVNLAVESGASLVGEVKVDDKDLRLIKTGSVSEEQLPEIASNG
ncbi:MAG TPA: polymer-forming cytoskeletal protein [Desulfobacterales bacterium]|nr:polymer-forming cytoskeletal protein [Desulfobacterales bacterium]